MSGIIATGSTFKWGGHTVTLLGEIGTPEITAADVDVSSHQSPGGFDEFLPGNKGVSDLALVGLFDPSDTDGQVLMYADAAAGTIREAIIASPNGECTFTVNGYLKNAKIGAFNRGDKIGFSATLKITGPPVLAISTSTGMSALSLSGSAVIYPTFAIGTFDYDATVLTAVSSLTFTPTAAAHTITIEANGLSQTVASGATSAAITLGAAGSRTPVKITVQQSGKAAKIYNIDILRA